MLIERPYVRERAVIYARRWALSRNPLFVDFTGIGGDCTNFVSQCILAGSCTMNLTPTYGWYYRSAADRAPAWSGVEALYAFLTGLPEFASENGGIGPYGHEVPPQLVRMGDVIQLADASGDFYHTLIVSVVTAEDFLVCAHANDALDRPLSSYSFAAARYIHIDGVRREIGEDACYTALLDGTGLPS